MKFGKWKHSNGTVADLDAGTATYRGETWEITAEALRKARADVAAGKPPEGNDAWERVLGIWVSPGKAAVADLDTRRYYSELQERGSHRLEWGESDILKVANGELDWTPLGDDPPEWYLEQLRHERGTARAPIEERPPEPEPREYVPTVALDYDRDRAIADETHDAILDSDAELHRRRMDYLLTGDVSLRDERAVVLPDPLRDDPEIAKADRKRRWALKARRS